MSKQENKQISLISEAKVVPWGVARIMELKENDSCVSNELNFAAIIFQMRSRSGVAILEPRSRLPCAGSPCRSPWEPGG